jgi:hypothetical protein
MQAVHVVVAPHHGRANVLAGVTGRVGAHTGFEVPAAAHVATKPDSSITTHPLQLLLHASCMILVLGSYTTTMT